MKAPPESQTESPDREERKADQTRILWFVGSTLLTPLATARIEGRVEIVPPDPAA